MSGCFPLVDLRLIHKMSQNDHLEQKQAQSLSVLRLFLTIIKYQ